jgi:hypothetical protein
MPDGRWWRRDEGGRLEEVKDVRETTPEFFRRISEAQLARISKFGLGAPPEPLRGRPSRKKVIARLDELDAYVDRLAALPCGRGKAILGKNVRESDVNKLAIMLATAYEQMGRPLYLGLIRLLARQLKVPGFGHRDIRNPVALAKAQEYVDSHRDAGVREIARHASVPASTVTRWFKRGKLKRGVCHST